MIVDTSVIVAILRGEAGSPRYSDLLLETDRPRLSAATFLEAAIVVDGGRNRTTSQQLEVLIEEMELTIEPVTAQQARIAREAYQRFGKGSGHPARLNFGDCFAYALAQDTGEPLLFVGDDFAQTDVHVAGDSR